MKTWDKLRAGLDDDVSEIKEDHDPELLNESLLRKGSGLVFFTKQRNAGNASVRKFESAKQHLNTNAGASLEDQVTGLTRCMSDLAEGLVLQREQIGSLASIALVAVLLSEKQRKRR
jgi:hypothetical protein